MAIGTGTVCVLKTSNYKELGRTKQVSGSAPAAGVGPQVTVTLARHQLLWGRRGSVSSANLLCAGVGCTSLANLKLYQPVSKRCWVWAEVTSRQRVCACN